MKDRILVATDGTPGSLAALRLARALADRDGVSVSVLAVLEPVYVEGTILHQLPSEGTAYPSLVWGVSPEDRDTLLDQVRKQLREIGGAAPQWEVRVETGSVALTIVRHATAQEAGLIAVGIGEHKPVDRWLRTETALEVVHLSHVPVFAAHPTLAGLPRNALAAVDFSTYSRDAALTVAEILETGAELCLVHVSWTPPPLASEEMTEWRNTYNVGCQTRLSELAHEIETRTRARVRTVLTDGEPARELLGHAEATSADVVAAGSHGRGFFSRILRGSTSTKLIRGANCSVLIAPPREGSDELRNALARGAEREGGKGSDLLANQYF